MDIYGTAELNRIVDEIIKPVPSFFLDTFYPEVSISEKEEIYFDVTSENKPRITPFVHPLHAGKLVEDKGYSTKSFKTAYVKDLRILNPMKTIKRRAGEAFTGALTMQQRAQLILLQQLQDQKDMLRRRLEVMAIEGVLSAKQTIVGEGINALVDFGRDAAMTIVLTGSAKWDAVGNTSQSAPFEDWSQMLLEKSGSGRGKIVMDTKAWKLFRQDAKFDKILDKTNKLSDASGLDLSQRFADEGASYKGNLGDFEVWVYSGNYINDAGVSTPLMPDNTVALIGNIEGVQHYGAILDLDVLQARESFTSSYVTKNPSARHTLMQSAPLLVPYRPNATLIIKVA